MGQVLVQVRLGLEESTTLGTHVLSVIPVDRLHVFVPSVLVLESLACQNQSAVSDKMDAMDQCQYMIVDEKALFSQTFSITCSNFELMNFLWRFNLHTMLLNDTYTVCPESWHDLFKRKKMILTTDITQVLPLVAVNNLVDA